MNTPPRIRSWDLALVLLAGLVVLGAGIGLRNPWPADEPVYALIARDMLAHGQYLLPMAGGDYFQDKPPLFFWLVAASDWLTHSLKAGFLLPSLLAGLGCLWLVHDLARRLWNREVAYTAAIALLVTVQFTLQARRAQLDALLMFFTLLSLYCLCRQLLLGGGWRWAIAAGLAAGFGGLAKVVGFLSFLVLLPWLYAVWRGWPGVRWQRPWFAWIGAAVACLAVIALWVVPLLLRAGHDPAVAQFRDEVLIEQTLGRYSSPWHHKQPWHYYLDLLIPLWLPLTLLLPWLVPGWIRSLRERDARVLLPLAWCVLYVAFFSLSSGKRDVYILTAVPGFVLAAAPQLPALLRRRGVQRALLGLLLFLAVVLSGGWAWLTHVRPAKGAALLADGGLESASVLWVVAVLALVCAAAGRLRHAGAAVAAFFGLTWLLLGFWLFPAMDATRSAEAFIARLEQQADPSRPLGLVEYREHFLWHLRRESTNFGHRRFREGDQEIYDAAAWLARDPRRQLLMAKDRVTQCFASADARRAGDAAGLDWWLVSGVPSSECVARGDARRAIDYRPRMPW